MSDNDASGFIFNSKAPYQSAQRKGQWIYSRYMNVSGEHELYANKTLELATTPGGAVTTGVNGFEYDANTPSGATGTTQNDFIWDGNLISPGVVQVGSMVPGSYDESLFYHIDHPVIQDYIASGATSGFTIPTGRMAKYSTIPSNEPFGEIQTPYGYDTSEGRGFKMSFEENDEYLLGGRSTGAYLFLSPVSIGSLGVDGDNKFGKRRIGPLDTKQVNSKIPKSPNLSVDIIFQYRMTDYFGVKATGAVDSFPGRIAGKHTNQVQNLTYSKKIGLDVFDSNNNQFSFDLRVFAKYKPIGLNLNNTGKVVLTQST